MIEDVQLLIFNKASALKNNKDRRNVPHETDF